MYIKPLSTALSTARPAFVQLACRCTPSFTFGSALNAYIPLSPYIITPIPPKPVISCTSLHTTPSTHHIPTRILHSLSYRLPHPSSQLLPATPPAPLQMIRAKERRTVHIQRLTCSQVILASEPPVLPLLSLLLYSLASFCCPLSISGTHHVRLTCIRRCACMYVSIYVSMYTGMYVCTYVCMHACM